MHVSRRDTFKLLLAGAATSGLPQLSVAAIALQPLILGNGLRAHLVANQSGYVSLSLILRSKNIVHQHGLAHIMEHTSFTGAAGRLSASEVAEAQRDYIQEGNASTALGVLQWDASFLPRYLPQVLSLLSDITLDQKFDTETVARETKIVLEELYLEKYNANVGQQKAFEVALYGKTHPHVARTLDAEIAAAKLSPERLTTDLLRYASTIRLPANMDLFIVGQFDPEQVVPVIEQHFGKYAYASGPYLELPTVGVTHAYQALSGVSHQLKRPLSEVKIGWNTGVRITDPDAPTLIALCEYLNSILFKQLREEHGEAYTPEAAYQPDAHSGIISIVVPSSKHPSKVEERVFQAIQSLKAGLDVREAGRMRDRAELQRRKIASSPEAMVACMVRKAIDGASADEMAPEAVREDELIAAACKYLPSHKGAYVRLALWGQ